MPRAEHASRPAKLPRKMPRNLVAASLDLLGFAQALDERGAQQKGAREFRVFCGAAQFVVVLLVHCRILLGEQALVANGLRLGVLERDVAALALIAVEDLLADLLA